jgi:hypothetical protein
MQRGFMFAPGCLQSQSCHTDTCPVGVATQDPTRQRALAVGDKWWRVKNFHAATLQAVAELVAAARLDHPNEFTPMHFSRRVSAREVETFAKLYPALRPGELLDGTGSALPRGVENSDRRELPTGNVVAHFGQSEGIEHLKLAAIPRTRRAKAATA